MKSENMKKILLIDNSPTILKTLEFAISSNLNKIEILLAHNYTEASNIIRHNRGDIYVAVVDLCLPDCSDGKAVLLTSSHNIPTIVLSGSIDNNLKTLMLKKDVLDFVDKNSKNSIKYVTEFVKKMIRNYDTTALVVDDSKLFRKAFRDDLEKLHINVLEASDGKEAIDVIKTTDKQISLILTDYNMPNMDGIELTHHLREKYDKDTLSIIAISATDNKHALAEFIKAGANDFITKPHSFEELNVRIHSNLDVLDLFQKNKRFSK